MRITTVRPMLLALPAAALVTLLGGCNSDPESFGAIAGNPTPDQMTLSERPIDVEKNMALTNDQNGRSAWNDLGRVWYTDHPSRLSPYPITSLTGQPR